MCRLCARLNERVRRVNILVSVQIINAQNEFLARPDDITAAYYNTVDVKLFNQQMFLKALYLRPNIILLFSFGIMMYRCW